MHMKSNSFKNNISIYYLIIILTIFLSCSTTAKDYRKLPDYIGTTWINRLEGTSIHFKNSNTIVFHILVDADSEYSPKSFLRKETNFTYEEPSNTFKIEELDAIPNVVLIFKDEDSKKYLQGIDQFWRLEESNEIVRYLK